VDVPSAFAFDGNANTTFPPASNWTPFTAGVPFSFQIFGSPSVTVAIDIRPATSHNRINPGFNGIIPVAILSGEAFDAATVDAATVRFGATGTEAVPSYSVVLDVNHDAAADLLLFFRTRSTGIACGATSAALTGMTDAGVAIEGSDSVRTIGCR
jgi:hypothetical protein